MLKNKTAKRVIKKLLLISLLLVNYNIVTYGQNNIKQNNEANKKLVLMATSMTDSIVLRWAPTDHLYWSEANDSGYILERTTLSADNKVEVRFKKLTEKPIKPWSKEMFLNRVNKNNKRDKYCAIAAQALYGSSFQSADSNNINGEANEFDIIIKQNKENQMRFSFALFAADVNARAANSLGLRFVDKSVERNKKYVYRLYAVPNSKDVKLDTALFIISPKDVSVLNRVTFVKTASYNNIVFLSWPKNNVENNFTAYNIERSNDNGKTFIQINENPFISTNKKPEKVNNTYVTYIDTVPVLYHDYIYRVNGINLFGQISPYSLPVTIKPKDDKAPPPPSINKSIKINDHTYKISWRDNNNNPDLYGYKVLRSKKVDSAFVQLNKEIIPVSVSSYFDSTAKSGQSYYYKVCALDTAGNFSTSIPDYVFTYDSIPPSIPIGLTGNIDTNGIVTLHWPLGTDDDIKGYRIYKSNELSHVFTPLSKTLITDTLFRDSITLKTLSRDIFYKIVAVDENYNSSEYSAPCRLIKPDIIPPVPAVFTDYKVTDTSIQLFWNHSSSNDFKQQYLLRKAENGDWIQIAILDNKQVSFEDKKMEKLKMYSYEIISEDSSGLKSVPSYTINAKTYYKVTKNESSRLVANVQPDNTSIKVEFAYQNSDNILSIVLYRSVNNSGMITYKNIEVDQKIFLDKNVKSGNTYSYSFKCIYKDHNESLLSDEVTVSITNKQ